MAARCVRCLGFMIAFFVAFFVGYIRRALLSDGILEPYADVSNMRGWRAKINSSYTHYAIFSEDNLEGKGVLHQKSLVIFVHGLAAQLDQLTWGVDGGLAKAVVDAGHSLLSYDMHGHGYSDAPDSPYSWRELVSQLEGLLSHLRITAPFTLVGFSTGSFVASAFASLHPQLVKKLVFISPFGGHLPLHSSPIVAGITAAFVQAVFEGNLCHLRTVYRIIMHLEGAKLDEFLEEIEASRIPASIIAGGWDNDPGMRILQTARRMDKALSNSKLHVISGGFHNSWATGDNTTQMNIRDIVLNFLEDVEARSA